MDQDQIRALLDYDPQTGVMVWIGGQRAGKVAGCLHRTGYLITNIRRKNYLLHRLAWLHFYGRWPDGDLDHANLDKTDNRIANLRLANDSTNQANTPIRRRNTSGRKGVCWNKASRKWQAAIKVRGKSLHLGLFDDLDTAANAYVSRAQELFGEFARTA